MRERERERGGDQINSNEALKVVILHMNIYIYYISPIFYNEILFLPN